MRRTRIAIASVVALSAAAFAVWTAAPATAEKPDAVVGTSFAPNGDCSVDFEITVNSRGQTPSLIVVHYWQRATQQGGNYQYLADVARGGTHGGRVGFTPADPAFGQIYDVGYTAFAKNGRILAVGGIGSVDAAGCL